MQPATIILVPNSHQPPPHPKSHPIFNVLKAHGKIDDILRAPFSMWEKSGPEVRLFNQSHSYLNQHLQILIPTGDGQVIITEPDQAGDGMNRNDSPHLPRGSLAAMQLKTTKASQECRPRAARSAD